ncbi:hypothetical protein, partial [Caballeronia sp. GACF4]|uniref:hypothetical protein n=1 Tax=Caballeronia sp. GACF4 TaxID=2921763 RepID=UPI002028BA07
VSSMRSASRAMRIKLRHITLKAKKKSTVVVLAKKTKRYRLELASLCINVFLMISTFSALTVIKQRLIIHSGRKAATAKNSSSASTARMVDLSACTAQSFVALSSIAGEARE